MPSSRPLASPRSLDPLDAMCIALASGHRGSQVGRVLKEVQRPPRLLLGVMHLGELATDRARKAGATGEVEGDVQAFGLLVERSLLQVGCPHETARGRLRRLETQGVLVSEWRVEISGPCSSPSVSAFWGGWR